MISTTVREQHAFVERPHRTMLALTIPIMASLVVEPLAGVVDTAFVERLSAAQAAALGASTVLLSSILWLFNFLAIGTQTEVAQALGEGRSDHARQAATLALALSLFSGLAVAIGTWAILGVAARWLSPHEPVQAAMITYTKVRLLGSPAALAVLVAFGALRGLQEMRTPMWIAAGISVMNIALDALLVFGAGPIPAFGIAGAAWATTASQLVGAVVAATCVGRRLGFSRQIVWRRSRSLFRVGRDMGLRTGSLLLFLLIAQRSALRISVESGAAHQAVRQIWMLTAFLLDAFASAAQSLVGYFVGARQRALAFNVARIATWWGLGTGTALTIALLLLQDSVARLLVPPSALGLFASAWFIFSLTQPLSALSFVTDGIHWGTADFAFLRNGMLVSTTVGLVGLAVIDPRSPHALAEVWAVTALWTGLRSAFGLARIWPGVGKAPLRL
jgi:MATE family multidrug resistance protein